MDISFTGFNENVLTFECTNTVRAGDLVKLSGSGKVTKAVPDEAFVGVCKNVRNGFAAVQLSGYVEAEKNGTIGVGYFKLAAATSGVKAIASGVDRLVIYSDDTKIGFIL